MCLYVRRDELTLTSSLNTSLPLVAPVAPPPSPAAAASVPSPTRPRKTSYMASTGSCLVFTSHRGWFGSGRSRKGMRILGGVCCHRGRSSAGEEVGVGAAWWVAGAAEKARMGWAARGVWVVAVVRAQEAQIQAGRGGGMVGAVELGWVGLSGRVGWVGDGGDGLWCGRRTEVRFVGGFETLTLYWVGRGNSGDARCGASPSCCVLKLSLSLSLSLCTLPAWTTSIRGKQLILMLQGIDQHL